MRELVDLVRDRDEVIWLPIARSTGRTTGGGTGRFAQRPDVDGHPKRPRRAVVELGRLRPGPGLVRQLEELLAFGRAGGLLEQAARAAAEVVQVDAALLGVLHDPLGELERLVEERRAVARSWPMSWRIVRSVRAAMIGSGTPSIQTRVRCPPPRSLPVIGSTA